MAVANFQDRFFQLQCDFGYFAFRAEAMAYSGRPRVGDTRQDPMLLLDLDKFSILAKASIGELSEVLKEIREQLQKNSSTMPSWIRVYQSHEGISGIYADAAAELWSASANRANFALELGRRWECITDQISTVVESMDSKLSQCRESLGPLGNALEVKVRLLAHKCIWGAALRKAHKGQWDQISSEVDAGVVRYCGRLNRLCQRKVLEGSTHELVQCAYQRARTISDTWDRLCGSP